MFYHFQPFFFAVPESVFYIPLLQEIKNTAAESNKIIFFIIGY
jgi:hypothetical protein